MRLPTRWPGTLLLALLPRAALASWVYQLGTKNWDSVQGLALHSGSIYVAGDTEGTLEQTRFGDSDIFVVKLNGTGDPLWVSQRGSIHNDRVGDIKVNSSGDVIIVGFTEASLDGIPWSGGHDIFVMALNADGAWLWTTQRGTFYEDHAAAVQLTDTGDIVVAGDTRGSLDGHTNAGHSDIFLMKFTGGGDWLWTRQRGSGGGDIAAALQLAGDNFVLAGYTGGDLDGHANAGGLDMFVMQMDSAGSWLWTHQRGSAFEDHGQALLITSGRIYVAGYTRGSLDGNSNQGFADVFLMEFDGTGAWQWTQQRGSAADDFAVSLQLTGDSLALGGFTSGSLDGNTNAGDEDLFVMEFDTNATWWRTQIWGTAERDFLSVMAVTDTNDVLLAGRTSGSLSGYRMAGVVDAFVATMSAIGSHVTEATSKAPSRLLEAFALLILTRALG